MLVPGARLAVLQSCTTRRRTCSGQPPPCAHRWSPLALPPVPACLPACRAVIAAWVVGLMTPFFLVLHKLGLMRVTPGGRRRAVDQLAMQMNSRSRRSFGWSGSRACDPWCMPPSRGGAPLLPAALVSLLPPPPPHAVFHCQ